MPHLGRIRARRGFALLVGMVAFVMLCPWPRATVRADWPWSTNSNEGVGTAKWWKKHKKEAVFEPGKGYRVEGVEGYFDGTGRPIAGPAAVESVVQAGEPSDTPGLLPELDPRVQYGKMKEAVGLGPNEQFARQQYAEGYQLFNEKKFKAASDKFKLAMERGPNSSLEQDAMFMLAESYFFDDRYIKARDAYDELVKKHANTRYMDTLIDREWKIARYWEERDEQYHHWPTTPNVYDKTRPWFDTFGHAIKAYESIRLNDPTGPRADDAIMATANMYFKRGRFEDADYNYTLLRREYPRSEMQFEAHLLGLQAKLRKYQGEDYDGTPLEEAKVLVKQLNSQFTGQLSKEEKDRLAIVEAQLQQEIATRDYRMAAYYDNKKDYGAARFYYAEVIRKYPDTELSKQARARAGEIAGEPEEAPKKLAFIVDRLPESRERSRVARVPELQNAGTRVAQTPEAGGSVSGSASSTTTK
ncbi:MAG: outer membrane protein assembly factor BamD [Pirellulales bacterium]|nr:outer membrane protein assembly factor BamD [Pirellulales bacterium]